MDFQTRIADANLHRDQTKGSYDAAKQQTQQSMTDYNKMFDQSPQFQTIYDQTKAKYTDSAEIQQMKSTWETAKSQVDSTRTMIDKLPESIGQQFGGTGLTQAQRDKARQQQLGNLSKQFQQYDANYQVSFANYDDTVEKAFNTSLDVANKEYDSYWDGVRAKYSEWQTRLSSENQLAKMYYDSRSAASKVQSEYDVWQMKQQSMQQQKEFVTWQNNFASMQRKQAADRAIASSNYARQVAKDAADKKLRWATAVSDYQSGKINATQLFATK